jgi:hypothetical protein
MGNPGDMKMTTEDMLKKEIANLQLQVHNAYVRIAELLEAEKANVSQAIEQDLWEIDQCQFKE